YQRRSRLPTWRRHPTGRAAFFAHRVALDLRGGFVTGAGAREAEHHRICRGDLSGRIAAEPLHAHAGADAGDGGAVLVRIAGDGAAVPNLRSAAGPGIASAEEATFADERPDGLRIL